MSQNYTLSSTDIVSCGSNTGILYKLETNQSFYCQNDVLFVQVMLDMKYKSGAGKVTVTHALVLGLLMSSLFVT